MAERPRARRRRALRLRAHGASGRARALDTRGAGLLHVLEPTPPRHLARARAAEVAIEIGE
ncbi:MAG: hypothetical protein M5U28_55620 [Sandaracinaceae bacterium]|nr:hypothetical protein [Sandaracinaceae bacterium]